MVQRLSIVVAVVLAASPAAAAQSDSGPVAAAAVKIIDTVWGAHLRHCGTSAFETLDGRVVLELDQPKFHLAPTKLKAAARQVGYEYQTTAIASARRWRWAPLTGPRKLKWSPWQEGETLSVRYDEFGGERGRTVVDDAVLQFDLVRHNGQWIANRPLSPLNSDFRRFDLVIGVPANSVPPCEQLVG